MAKEKNDSSSKVDNTRVALACALALIIPGAGHLFLRKYVHAVVFFVSVVALAVAGASINGEMHSFLRSNSGEGFLQLMAALGNIALGVLHLIFHAAGFGLGSITTTTYEYGTTFIIVAALINVLVILNAYDIARGEKE